MKTKHAAVDTSHDHGIEQANSENGVHICKVSAGSEKR
jgi:hypothetical protein